MTGTLLHSGEPIKQSAHKEVFFCPEESQFYSHCLERLVFNHCQQSDVVLEFGSGDGSPVINSLLRAPFDSTIYGYELNASACKIARSRINDCDLEHKYIIYNQSFFDSLRPTATFLIANPPYLPAIDNNICMPLLHGGTDGASITNRLLTLNYPNVMVLISSYSNPVGTIAYALENGYAVDDFLVTPLPFGYYSSEPKVRNCIAQLRQKRKAFYSNKIYFLAGVLFRKKASLETDLSSELIRVVTAL